MVVVNLLRCGRETGGFAAVVAGALLGASAPTALM
jgi:hypothetical protein